MIEVGFTVLSDADPPPAYVIWAAVVKNTSQTDLLAYAALELTFSDGESVADTVDRLAALAVSATSPDGNITARLRAARPTAFAFRSGTYERCTEPELAHQLARTLELLYIARDREVNRVMNAAGPTRATRPEHALDELRHGYLAELQSLAATGTGPHGCVTFDVEGTARWRCRIADGTLRWLPSPTSSPRCLPPPTTCCRALGSRKRC